MIPLSNLNHVPNVAPEYCRDMPLLGGAGVSFDGVNGSGIINSNLVTGNRALFVTNIRIKLDVLATNTTTTLLQWSNYLGVDSYAIFLAKSATDLNIHFYINKTELLQYITLGEYFDLTCVRTDNLNGSFTHRVYVDGVLRFFDDVAITTSSANYIDVLSVGSTDSLTSCTECHIANIWHGDNATNSDGLDLSNDFVNNIYPINSVSFLKLDASNGSTIFNSSGNDNHGTLEGGATWITTNEYSYRDNLGYSLYSELTSETLTWSGQTSIIDITDNGETFTKNIDVSSKTDANIWSNETFTESVAITFRGDSANNPPLIFIGIADPSKTNFHYNDIDLAHWMNGGSITQLYNNNVSQGSFSEAQILENWQCCYYDFSTKLFTIWNSADTNNSRSFTFSLTEFKVKICIWGKSDYFKQFKMYKVGDNLAINDVNTILGYNNIYIPRDESNTEFDVLGNDLEFKGFNCNIPYSGIPSVWIDASQNNSYTTSGDSVTSAKNLGYWKGNFNIQGVVSYRNLGFQSDTLSGYLTYPYKEGYTLNQNFTAAIAYNVEDFSETQEKKVFHDLYSDLDNTIVVGMADNTFESFDITHTSQELTDTSLSLDTVHVQMIQYNNANNILTLLDSEGNQSHFQPISFEESAALTLYLLKYTSGSEGVPGAGNSLYEYRYYPELLDNETFVGVQDALKEKWNYGCDNRPLLGGSSIYIPTGSPLSYVRFGGSPSSKEINSEVNGVWTASIFLNVQKYDSWLFADGGNGVNQKISIATSNGKWWFIYNGVSVISSIPHDLPLNEWFHLVVTFDGSFSIWVNGVRVVTDFNQGFTLSDTASVNFLTISTGVTSSRIEASYYGFSVHGGKADDLIVNQLMTHTYDFSQNTYLLSKADTKIGEDYDSSGRERVGLLAGDCIYEDSNEYSFRDNLGYSDELGIYNAPSVSDWITPNFDLGDIATITIAPPNEYQNTLNFTIVSTSQQYTIDSTNTIIFRFGYTSRSNTIVERTSYSFGQMSVWNTPINGPRVDSGYFHVYIGGVIQPTQHNYNADDEMYFIISTDSMYWVNKTQGIKSNNLGSPSISVGSLSIGIGTASLDIISVYELWNNDFFINDFNDIRYIPRDESSTEFDVLGNDLEFKGKACKNVSQPITLEIDTTLGSLTFVLPTNGSGYDYTVTWGDGIEESDTTSHTYSVDGVYVITITGLFPKFYFNSSASAPMLKSVDVGDLDVSYGGNDFYGCDNLESVNIVNANSLYASFREASNFNQDLNTLDVSNVITTSNTFRWASNFNQDISSWDVSSVVNMSLMFYGASNFNQDISGWDVSSVVNMSSVFYAASNFNQDISGWNTPNATNMYRVFYDCINFNSPLTNWSTSNATTFSGMFSGCTKFNQPLSHFDVSATTSMSQMFFQCSSFNSSLIGWTQGESFVTCSQMFFGCSLFNQDISSFNMSTVSSAYSMFYGASNFDQDISGWDMGSNQNFLAMFYKAESFDQPIGVWDTSSATDMKQMFYDAISFNQDLSGWDVSSVTNFTQMFWDANEFTSDLSGWVTDSAITMDGMFVRCSGFNSNLSSWNTSGVTTMINMFNGCSSFNQNLGAWDIGNVTDMTSMFSSSNLSDANCELTIEGWFGWNGTSVINPTQSNVTCSFNNNSISSTSDAGQIVTWMIANRGWTFTNLTLI